MLVSGYNLLAAGCIGPFVCAASRKYGKRPVFLASTVEVPPKKTFVQSLAVFTGVYSQDSVFKFLFGPVLTLLMEPRGMLCHYHVGLAQQLVGTWARPSSCRASSRGLPGISGPHRSVISA